MHRCAVGEIVKITRSAFRAWSAPRTAVAQADYRRA
jgi:hypothetical protein